MVDASRVLQEMVGVLSDPEWGTAIFVIGQTSSRESS